MARFRITLEYDGTGLAGWQRQVDMPSVQSLVEEAATKLAGAPVEVVGAGRTDAGVHAVAQVAHLDVPKPMSAHNVLHGLNYHLLPLTPQIVVVGAEEAPDDFHARFDARERRYLYRLVNRSPRLALKRLRAWHVTEPLDAGAMHEAAQLLVGTHDFTTFRSSICQAKSPVKTLDQLDVTRAGDEIHIHAVARSFLHHQVRNLAGSLRRIGNGKWTSTDLSRALEARDRREGGETAPPEGLYLFSVSYPGVG